MGELKSPVFACPEDQHGFAKVYDHANTACRLISEHGTPPFPNTFALMFAYAAKSDKNIVVAVDEMLERGALCKYEIDEVYNLHLRPSDDDAKRETIGREVEQQLSSVLDLVGTSMENSDQFELALKQIEQGLSDSSSTSALSAAVAQLMTENRRMTEQSRKLSEGLLASKQQIERLQLELEAVRNESMRDPLTSIFNRRAFDVRLATEMDTAKKQGSSLCLAIADLDHFKRVNDNFGHRVGDEILKIFASVISTNIKGKDMVARYGGEEFAVILPATDLAAAAKLLDRIREQMSQRRLMLKGSKTPIGSITASFGVAQYRPGMDVSDLVELADQRLYQAKSAGRDQVQADDATPNAA